MISPFLACFALLACTNFAFAEQCACAKIPINVQEEPTHTSRILTLLSGEDCLAYNEHDETGQDGITWANVNYKGHKAWIAKHYVDIEVCSLDKQSKRADWSDIGYSFIIGEDGNVYEGRGWDEIGAHTLNYNSVGLGFCMIGNFMDHVPNDAALNAVKQLIACGVANHKISSTYILHGHRDVGQTECPGNKLYDLIQAWPHYSRHQG